MVGQQWILCLIWLIHVDVQTLDNMIMHIYIYIIDNMIISIICIYIYIYNYILGCMGY